MSIDRHQDEFEPLRDAALTNACAEQQASSRVDNERARRIAIQATVSRRVDDLVRMLDPAFRDRTHAEYVRDLAVLLGQLAEYDEGDDDGIQAGLVILAVAVQSYMEANLREAAV